MGEEARGLLTLCYILAVYGKVQINTKKIVHVTMKSSTPSNYKCHSRSNFSETKGGILNLTKRGTYKKEFHEGKLPNALEIVHSTTWQTRTPVRFSNRLWPKSNSSLEFGVPTPLEHSLNNMIKCPNGAKLLTKTWDMEHFERLLRTTSRNAQGDSFFAAARTRKVGNVYTHTPYL